VRVKRTKLTFDSMSKNHLLWMLAGCGLFIIILAVFGGRLSSGWIVAIVIGACVVPHLFMMRGHDHEKSTHSEGEKNKSKDEQSLHKGGCCH
jgi:Flp pilus assembly protein TadB